MAFDTLANTTSFSGSDITVIAYRSNKSPAEQFKLDNLKRRRKAAEAQQDRARSALIAQEEEVSRKILKTQDQVADLEKRKRKLLASGVPQDSTAWRSIDGKAQNKKGQITQLQKERFGINREPLDLAQKELDRVLAEEASADQTAALFKLGTLHTISYSSFREKFAVRSIGITQAKEYTRGPRTIAGTMVFNMVQEHELLSLLGSNTSTQFGKEVAGFDTMNPIDNTNFSHPAAVMLDQIQPFNIMLLFANEFGAYSAMHMFNVDISSEGQEMSVDQIITHNTMNFYATDLVPLRNLGNAWQNYDQMINGEVGRGLVGLSQASSDLRVAEKNKLTTKRKTDSINDLLQQSRGRF